MAELKPQLVEKRTNLGLLAPLTAPYVVYVESSSFCNLACKFCPHFINPEEIQKQHMSLAVFEKLCLDLGKFPQKIKLLRFCGLGDSLMNKAFPSFVQLATEMEIADRFELITNGLLLKSGNLEI